MLLYGHKDKSVEEVDVNADEQFTNDYVRTLTTAVYFERYLPFLSTRVQDLDYVLNHR